MENKTKHILLSRCATIENKNIRIASKYKRSCMWLFSRQLLWTAENYFALLSMPIGVSFSPVFASRHWSNSSVAMWTIWARTNSIAAATSGEHSSHVRNVRSEARKALLVTCTMSSVIFMASKLSFCTMSEQDGSSWMAVGRFLIRVLYLEVSNRSGSDPGVDHPPP